MRSIGCIKNGVGKYRFPNPFKKWKSSVKTKQLKIQYLS